MSNMNINLKEHGTQIKCTECGNETFSEVLYLFKVSRMLTGEAKDSMVPVPTFSCSECGHVNSEFSLNPEETEKVKPANLITGPGDIE